MNTAIESHKGLVKRLLSQLELDIDQDKAVQLCNAFYNELLQGAPVGYSVFSEKWIIHKFSHTEISAQKKLNTWQVGWPNNKAYISAIYTAPPSTESLQKELDDLKLDIANYVSLNSSLLEENAILHEAMKVLNQIADGKRKTRERNLAYSFVKFIETQGIDIPSEVLQLHNYTSIDELFGKTEQLNKDKAELIEYARKLRYAHELNSTTIETLDNVRFVSEQALSIAQPKCMRQGE